jgi:hypothetical protein
MVDEVGVPGENHWHAASHQQILACNVVFSTPGHVRYSNSQRRWWLADCDTEYYRTLWRQTHYDDTEKTIMPIGLDMQYH